MRFHNLIVGVSLMGVMAFSGCDRGKVAAYDVPKETPPGQAEPSSQPGADAHAGMQMSRPSLGWGELPDGWTEASSGSGMRLATFSISGSGDESAELAIIPMGGYAGTDEQLVNMWRMQLGLPELASSEAEGQGDSASIGGEEGRVYEMAGNAQGVDTRLVVASVNKNGVYYFFKLIGNDSLVASQKDTFFNFLKGVDFEAAPAMPAGHPPTGDGMAMGMGQGMMGGGATVPPGSGDHPEWQVPEGWTEVAHSPFLVAKFQVTNGEGGSADINVSTSPGDGGGMLPNVNRWRGQLSLGALDEAGVEKATSTLDFPSGQATVVDFSGEGAENGDKVRCVAVVASVSGQTWFYKIMGSEALVAQEKEALLNFVRSVKY